MSAEVFISYARDDRERVMPLVDRLRQSGVSVWVDEGGIHGATLWGKEIVEAIRHAKAFVLVATKSSFDSKNVVKEVAIASEWDKAILPVYLEPVQVPDTLHYQLAGIQHVEYYAGREKEAFQGMIASLNRIGVNTGSTDDANAATPAESHTHHAGEPRISDKNRPVIWLLALAVFGLALAVFLKPSAPPNPAPTLADPTAAPAPATNQAQRIAVVPFRNIGPEQENNYLAEGMHEEIDAMLSMAPNLVVKDASRFRDPASDAKAIGESLQVDAIVTGSVRQAKGQLRVIVKLVDTQTEANLWAKTFDKTEDDVFAVQREIAQSVAQGLSIQLDAEFKTRLAKRQTDNLEAYNLYLEGRKLWNTRSRANMRDSIDKFELALSKDPTFALAHVGIADAYNQLVRYGYSPSIVSHTKAGQELEKALAINNQLSEAHASLGWVQFCFEWDWAASEKSFQRALKINPNNPEARRWYSRLLWILNRGEDALREIDTGIRLDPQSPIMQWARVNVLVFLSRTSEAMEAANKAVELDPGYSKAILAQVQAHTLNGDHAKALELANQGIQQHNNHVSYLVSKALALARLGNKEEARGVLNEVIEKSRQSPVPKSSIALIHCHLDDHDTAVSLLEEALAEKGSNLAFSYVEGDWPSLHNNVRFQSIWKQMGLPPKSKP